MVDFKELVKRRGTIKGKLTAFTNYLNNLKGDLSSAQITELQLRISKADSLLTTFDDVQTSIELIVEDTDDTYAQAIERTEFENQYYSVLARAQECHRYHTSKLEDDDNESYKSGFSGGNAEPVRRQTKSGSSGIKLPTIQIPKFSGQYEDWLEFRDTFESLIHSNASIGDVQKFHYLRASLEGSAAQVIRSLEFSSSNYVVAWELLCDRFNNTKLLIQNHVQSIFSIEPIKRESAQSIRKILDTISKNLRSLDILGEPTQSWDTLIIYIINSKLDSKTSREWEERKSELKYITLKEFQLFLKNKADLLETIYMSNKVDKYKHTTENVKGLAAVTNTEQSICCPVCNESHRIYNCHKFLSQSINERADSVRKLKLCINCLRPGHQARVCRLGTCTKCSRSHNTLLHYNTPIDAHEDREPPVARTATLSVQTTERVLLSTAVVYIRGQDNQRHEAKAVLDSGSQASFMTEALLNKLKLTHTKTHTSVVGINNTLSQITKRCNTSIESRVNPYTFDMSFLVLPNITSLCTNSAHTQKLEISTQIKLADPEYYKPSDIDLLLGADIFWDLIEQGQIRFGTRSPVLQQTKLGYIVSGPTSGLIHTSRHSDDYIACNLIKNDYIDIHEQLTKFWSIEETTYNSKPVYSSEERSCEEHFLQNFTRTDEGRFSVAIPLKMSETSLGNSFDRAKQCFFSLERRLQRLPKLKQMYTDFMAEYKDLGHMSVIADNSDSNTQRSYYLPHHGVLRESSTTTKLRVVFNASAPTSTGISLNDLQMVGPTIQSDLFSILIRFRHYSYVMTGDIEKMYRQVIINENQRHLQQIIWRDDPSKNLQTYQLNTVTYGTASAPFLAIRCLKQLANECENDLISQIISEDFYVDDLVTGSQSLSQLHKIRDDICKVLSTGCFNLRKINSNVVNFTSNSADPSTPLTLGEQNTSTTLGLGWSSSKDELLFSQRPTVNTMPTKRSMLSSIGQIFDPLGLLSVYIIQCKILLQKLWLHKISWDDPLPPEIIQTWTKFMSDLSYLNDLRIPRCVSCKEPSVIELHTFCDSSKDAYGACIYVKSTSSDNHVQTTLLCAKTRVAPLKPITIPRLELCGALLGARLTEKVCQAFRLPIHKCFLWTDSTIVLGWLKTAPSKLKQFVRNRVAEIQELTQNNEWRYVPTQLNPADLLTRGVDMSKIQDLDLWWTGPSFLLESENNWPNISFNQMISNDSSEIVSHIAVSEPNSNNELIDVTRFSKLSRLQRSLAYALRFVYNCKTKDSKLTGPLSKSEVEKSFELLLKQSQIKSFPEYNTLKKNQSIPNKSNLIKLTPFLDKNGLLRVGGRLQNSNYDYDVKHPALLSCKHPLAKLIFTQEHIRMLHAAPQLLLSSIRQRFWPLGGRNLAKTVVHKCLSCFRMKGQTMNPIMGQLPEERVNPGYPFKTTGVDYAGPLLAADRKGRGCRLIKVYVALFVCFSTKAIHLELVTDLTKDAYIGALRRFIARRSKPCLMFSDNGTQFVGAKNEINNFLKFNSNSLSEVIADEGIQFKFIPAYAPHFGGLWEAGVKSFKYHLVRVLGASRLTFEELYTALVQIESILNSRPLTPLSPDPNDLTPLTPGHFLVGRPLTALPSPRVEDVNSNRLQRWERVEQLRQHFWARWHKEYVSELQQKSKWQSTSGCLNRGAMVLIKEDGLPPMKWLLGRVQNVHSGIDGVNRVADILTTKGVIRRAFNKICPLPIEDSRDSCLTS